jgi:1,2-phenylacetyl-CoA epoxidase PaaB subunit
MEEVHLLQQSSMTTQHQIYTRNKMAVKIWTQKNSLWLYTGNINSYSVTTLTEQIVVEKVCAYLVRKRETIQATAHTIRMNWTVVTFFWQDWLPRSMSICPSSL